MNIPGNLKKFHLQVFIVPYLLKWIFLQRLPIQNHSKQSIAEKIAHMWRRWGTPHNFCLAFIDELEKQLFIKKAVEVGQ